MNFICMIFLVFILSVQANSFTLNSSSQSNLKGWDGGDVKIYLNTANCPSGVDVLGILNDAMAVWNNVPTSSIKVSYGGATSGTSASSPPTVYCETNYGSISGSPDPNSIPGAAIANAPYGQITSGIIFLNATSGNANIGQLSRTLVTVVLAHEIGHLLGLGHSSSTNALMYYDATYKTNMRLSQDDIDGMSYLYPSDEFKNSKFAGCGLVKNLPPPSSGQLSWILALLLLPVGIVLKLRNRSLGIKS